MRAEYLQLEIVDKDSDQVVQWKRQQQIKFIHKHCPAYYEQARRTVLGSSHVDPVSNVNLSNDDFSKYESLEKQKGFRRVNEKLKLYAANSSVRKWDLKKLKPEVTQFTLSNELLSLATTNLSMSEFSKQQRYKSALREANVSDSDHFWRQVDFNCLKVGNRGSDFHSVLPCVQQCLIENDMLAFDKMPAVFQNLTEYDKVFDKHHFFWNEETCPALAFALRNQAMLQRRILELLFKIMEYESPKFGEIWTPLMKLKSHLWSLTQSSWDHISAMSARQILQNKPLFSHKWKMYIREFPVATVKTSNVDSVFQHSVPFSSLVPSSVRRHLEKHALPRGEKRKRFNNDDGNPPKKQNVKGQFKCTICGGNHKTKNCGKNRSSKPKPVTPPVKKEKSVRGKPFHGPKKTAKAPPKRQ